MIVLPADDGGVWLPGLKGLPLCSSHARKPRAHTPLALGPTQAVVGKVQVVCWVAACM